MRILDERDFVLITTKERAQILLDELRSIPKDKLTSEIANLGMALSCKLDKR